MDLGLTVVNHSGHRMIQGAIQMIPGLYSAATAMDASTRRHEIAAENLANIQMPGYRQRVVSNATFETFFPRSQTPLNNTYPSKLLGTATSAPVFSFQQGPIEDTGNPLNLALNGPGFFTVQGNDGPLYTRNGSFYVNDNRELMTIDQLPIMGTGGPIVLPDNVSTEQVVINADGQLLANGQEFGQLALVDFSDTGVLQAAGASLFSAPGDVTPVTADAQVMQGHLELSNTSSIDEMITLIECTRHLDAAQKALQTIAESVQKRIGLR